LATELSAQVPRGRDAPAFAKVVLTSRADELPAQQLADLLVIVSENDGIEDVGQQRDG
jgi:hypothetical protein